MTPAQKILELIENVDPADKQAMDEIDAKVFEYETGQSSMVNEVGFTGRNIQRRFRYIPKYTRSRDALKAIRPEGYWCEFKSASDGDWVGILGRNKEYGINLLKFMSNYRPTEELAELHAIIQAIEWERTDGKI